MSAIKPLLIGLALVFATVGCESTEVDRSPPPRIIWQVSQQ